MNSFSVFTYRIFCYSDTFSFDQFLITVISQRLLLIWAGAMLSGFQCVWKKAVSNLEKKMTTLITWVSFLKSILEWVNYLVPVLCVINIFFDWAATEFHNEQTRVNQKVKIIGKFSDSSCTKNQIDNIICTKDSFGLVELPKAWFNIVVLKEL